MQVHVSPLQFGDNKTLYQIDSKGKVRYFNIKIEDGLSGTVVATETGILEGSPVGNMRSFPSISKALVWANAQFNDKLDKDGYKPIADKNASYTEVEQYLYHNHPVISNRYNYPLPMLAQPGKKKHWAKAKFAQRKYDGVRSLAQFATVPTSNNIRQIIQGSRGGKYYNLPHIKDELLRIFSKDKAFNILANKYPRVFLDGEIYKHYVPLAKISGTVRTTDEEVLAMTDTTWLEFHVYDIIFEDMNYTVRMPMEKRMSMLDMFREAADDSYCVVPVETYRLQYNDEMEIKQLHDKFVAEGYEGAILRTADDPYEFGIRSHSLIKVKEFLEKEYRIIDIEMNDSIGIASFVFVLADEKGIRFKARAMGSHGLWEHYYRNPPIGKMATLRFLNYSINGIPEKAVVKAIRDYE